MTHAIQLLSAAIKYVPASICNYQLTAIKSVQAIFSNWISVEASLPVPPTAVPHPPTPTVLLKKTHLLTMDTLGSGCRVSYRRCVFFNSTVGLGGFGTAVGGTVRDASTDIQFENIARTALMAEIW